MHVTTCTLRQIKKKNWQKVYMLLFVYYAKIKIISTNSHVLFPFGKILIIES